MKKVIYFLFLILAVGVTSCELPENVDPKYAKEVTPEALFTYAEIELADQVGSINVNTNVTRLLAQYQSEVTYVTESRYNFADRQIPDQYFFDFYERILMNLKIAYESLEALPSGDAGFNAVKANKMAIIEVVNVYAYQILVDAFGNVPYTEALGASANSMPKYDDAYTIYMDLVDRLDAAIADMDDAYDSFEDADVMYEGDVALWKAFAASLKLRIGMRLADVPAAGSNTIVTEARATGVFAAQEESAIFVYSGIFPYVNSYYNEFVVTKRKDFNPTTTLVNRMNTLNDPRRPKWFTEYPEAGTFTGQGYGLAAASSYSKFSHFSEAMRLDPSYPVIFSDYVEMEFLLAEAAERSLGGLVPADAEAHYNNAILASMKYWGVSDIAAAAYLAQPAVAYTTAAGNYKEKIGTQKWFGLFDRGPEAWAEWRRLDYPELTPPTGMTYADIPVRMPYPFNENKQNKDHYTEASTAIGGDEVSTQLFWDTVDSPFLPVK